MDLSNPVARHAFLDEMEKLAGLPSAIRKGGGGAYGALARNANSAGRTAAQNLSAANSLATKAGKSSGVAFRAASQAQDSGLSPLQRAAAAARSKMRERSAATLREASNKRLSQGMGQMGYGKSLKAKMRLLK